MPSPTKIFPLLLAALIAQGAHAANDRLGVLITDWAEAEGFADDYRKIVVDRSAGERAETPDQPCTQEFVGDFPFRVSLGLLPHAVAFPTKGLETVYDSFGFYRLSQDGKTYVSVYDPAVTLAVDAVPKVEGMVRPAVDSRRRMARSFWGIDPRDGTNYFEGMVQIGDAGSGPGPNPLAMPNGIRDANEMSYLAAMTDMRILFTDQKPKLAKTTRLVDESVRETLGSLFGTRIDLRFGAYAPTAGLMPLEEDVALEMARAGHRRFVVTRETTDNNNYANNFMTRGTIARALCKAGFTSGLEFQQVRQVGRTPEYNTMLMSTIRPHLQSLPQGTEVAVLYTTYGLPWPGRTGAGPFSAPHPWAKEVYHENAYNNYLSFKRYAEAEYGTRYRLVFTHPGKSGDLRTDNYYSYGLMQQDDLRSEPAALRFRTLRENIDAAKQAGRRQILIPLSHWYYSSRDTLIAIRVMQKVPVNSRADLKAEKYWIDWCERVDSPEPVPCNGPDVVHLMYTEPFDKVAKEFGINYAHRIRGGIERFGVMPQGLDVKVLASGAVTRAGGGSVAATSGRLAGAKLAVAQDAHPDKPESFTTTAYETFHDAANNFVSSWDDYTAYIGTQKAPRPATRNVRGAEGRRISVASEAVLFGPYRTLVNRPAQVTLPVAQGYRGPLESLRPYVYNEITRGWDPVYAVPGGSAPRVDASTRSVTFDVQAFGVFVLLAQ